MSTSEEIITFMVIYEIELKRQSHCIADSMVAVVSISFFRTEENSLSPKVFSSFALRYILQATNLNERTKYANCT